MKWILLSHKTVTLSIKIWNLRREQSIFVLKLLERLPWPTLDRVLRCSSWTTGISLQNFTTVTMVGLVMNEVHIGHKLAIEHSCFDALCYVMGAIAREDKGFDNISLIIIVIIIVIIKMTFYKVWLSAARQGLGGWAPRNRLQTRWRHNNWWKHSGSFSMFYGKPFYISNWSKLVWINITTLVSLECWFCCGASTGS